MIGRRGFISAVAGVHLAIPHATTAQPVGKVPRIGWLGFNAPEAVPHQYAAFRQGLRDHGWVEGRNILIEYRSAGGRADRLPALAAELVRLDVDLLVTASSASTRAAKDATTTIPIVMAASANAPAEGLVASLARPGGNITGMTFLAGPEIAGKQLQLLKEVVPAAARIAVLVNPANASHAAFLQAVQVAARSLEVQLQVAQAQTPDQIEGALAAITRERAAAMLVLTDAMFLGQYRRLADLAARSRLPAMYSQREFVEAGGLVAYGPSLPEMFRRAATHVDKILRGAKPVELPVEQPTKFELVINLKTAKTLGIVIPQSVLLRADEVIE